MSRISIGQRLSLIYKPPRREKPNVHQYGPWQDMGFTSHQNKAGSFLVREVPVQEINVECPTTEFVWKVIEKKPKELELAKVCFLDLETTGLNLGAGAFAFTVGIGYLHSGKPVVRQYFLRDHREELAVLRDLQEFLEQFDGMATYNGKCFDWPLLSDRFLLHRLTPPDLEELHLDLLHAARRVWKGVLPSFSLREVERGILGFERTNDLPGYLVPAAYVNFLRTGAVDEIPSILEHNCRDIASLIELIQRLERVFLGVDRCSWRDEVVNVAKIWADRRDPVRAIDYLEKYLDSGGSLTVPDLCFLARLHKGQGNYDRAAELWNEAAATASLNAEPWLELAKYYEHRQRDYSSARECALKAMEIETRMARLCGRTPKTQDLARRLARLEAKLGFDIKRRSLVIRRRVTQIDAD